MTKKNFIMRIFITVIVLIFSFQSWSKADDIRDLEIEGIGIGDSLLKYMTLEAILKDLEYIYPDDGFWAVTFKPTYDFENYDNVLVHGKKNDSDYLIYSITADIYNSNVEDCLNKKKKISKDVKSNFSFISSKDTSGKHEGDSGTKTYSTYFFFNLKNESIRVACYDWSKESGHPKTTKVSLYSSEFIHWLESEAYN